MWHGFVFTIPVTTSTAHGKAIIGVIGTDRQSMLVIVSSMSRVQVAVVQIIRMITMLDSFVTTLPAVTVSMVFMGLAVHHILLTFCMSNSTQ